jgi:putative nucleotidyltransferase with HDIG domain
MEEQPVPRLIRYLPHMVVTTVVVAVCPMLLAWWLSTNTLSSVLVSCVAATAWSLIAAYAGGRYWRSRPDAGDVLFGDLMIWGWLRRLWSERRMRNALTLLAGVDRSASVSSEQREAALRALASALEAGDPYTSGHSRRVARHAERIAMSLGLSPREVAKIRTAAILHDVGKVRTPKAILHKPGRLTDEEFAVIKLHPVDGAEMVSILGDAELTAIILHHHERLDGAGYPAGLMGEAIPIGARIISVADTFDAITSVRPYRQARTHRQALAILEAEAGTQLDREAVKAFERYYTGSRPLAVWMPFASGVQRLTSLIGGGVSSGATSIGRVALAASVTSATAAVAVSLPASGGSTTSSPHPATHDSGSAVAAVGHAASQAAPAVSLHPRAAAVRGASSQRRQSFKRAATLRPSHHTRPKVHVVATPSVARPPVYVAAAPVSAAPVSAAPAPVVSNPARGGTTSTTATGNPTTLSSPTPKTPHTPSGSGRPVGKPAGKGKPEQGKPEQGKPKKTKPGKGAAGGGGSGKATGDSGKPKHHGGASGSAGNSGKDSGHDKGKGTGSSGNGTTGSSGNGTTGGSGNGTTGTGSGKPNANTGSGSANATGGSGSGTGGSGSGNGGSGAGNGNGSADSSAPTHTKGH